MGEHDAWHERTTVLFRSASSRALLSVDARKQVESCGRRMSPLLAGSGGLWDADVDLRVWKAWGEPGPGMVPPVHGLLGRSTALLKCLKVANLTLRGRADLLADADLAMAASHLEDPGVAAESARRDAARPAPPPRPGTGATTVGAAFAWRSMAWRETGLSIGTVPLTLVHLDAEEAPVACRLRTPEGHLAVRSTGSGFLRPVLAPGRWCALDLAGFAAAATSGEAWLDSPLGDRHVWGALSSLSEVGRPEATSSPRGRDADRREVARAAAEARAAHLWLIDGIVHRSTVAPVLDLRCHAVRRWTHGVVDHPPELVRWRLDGDLNMLDEQDVFGRQDVRTFQSSTRNVNDGWHAVDVTAHAEVASYVAHRRAVDAVLSPRDAASATEPVVTDVDPTLLPDAGRGLAGAAVDVGAEATAMTRRTPDMEGALAAARAAALRPEGLDAVREALGWHLRTAGHEQVAAVVAIDAALREHAVEAVDEEVASFVP